ncbi:MAG: type I-B CRISPR-associated protein Cas8b1/Cst1 [Methanotrichaceae archaeon]|nr:type I-B CRISPR-associated protein Cas8b1/Cst1 [Methanotrichaceae archaeon]
MLSYTGHPLVDVGAATILAFRKKTMISDLTESDLDKMADYISREYVVNPLKSFLTVAFPNSGFTQPAFEKNPEKRVDYARRVTRSFHDDMNSGHNRCVFTGGPTVSIALSDKKGYPQGRVFRQHVPLLLGENQINFFANGNSGLPISGKALLCIQAMPLGCAKCGGKLLAVHSDNAEIIEKFAKKFLQENRSRIELAHQANESKLKEFGSARTVIIDTLLEADEEMRIAKEDDQPASITAYHFSNSGQSNALDSRNPPLEIYYLPMELLDFLAAIKNPDYRDEWSAIVQRAWRLYPSKKAKKSKGASDDDNIAKRNYLYEDLFRLPQDAHRFLRSYFLRMPIKNTSNDDPRRAYSLKGDAGLISWKLTELFLNRVMDVKESRINLIREIGDKLADYVNEENDKKFFSIFYGEQGRYDVLRNALIRVNHNRLKQGKPPIIRFDPFIEVFEDPDERGRSNWRLARDLVLIRMIERLYDLKWIDKHVDSLPETREDASQDESQII